MRSEAMYTGTLIEDLFKTVERAERKAEAEQLTAIEMAEAEHWLAAVQQSLNHESIHVSKLIGVA